MKEAKTFVGVEKTTTLINNNQAKKLALLSILKTDIKYMNKKCKAKYLTNDHNRVQKTKCII